MGTGEGGPSMSLLEEFPGPWGWGRALCFFLAMCGFLQEKEGNKEERIRGRNAGPTFEPAASFGVLISALELFKFISMTLYLCIHFCFCLVSAGFLPLAPQRILT